MKMGIPMRARHPAIVPALGVVPPSIRLSHNSTRPAPPASAARADSTESMQASMRMRGLGMERLARTR